MSRYKNDEYRQKHAAHARDWRKRNKKKNAARVKRWNMANREKYRITQRNAGLIKNYGISLEEWNLMLSAQGMRCAICRTDDPGRYWHTDHCHTTKKVRGILCGGCNAMLGYAKDDPAILKAGIAYLRKGLLLQPRPNP